jgi:hypothetical protein
MPEYPTFMMKVIRRTHMSNRVLPFQEVRHV